MLPQEDPNVVDKRLDGQVDFSKKFPVSVVSKSVRGKRLRARLHGSFEKRCSNMAMLDNSDEF
jgi:hypothetical protein